MNERTTRSNLLSIFGRLTRIRELVFSFISNQGSKFMIRDLLVLVVAYFIFDYGLRIGQSYEASSSQQKLQNCLAVIKEK